MRFDVITLFPQMFESPFASSMVSRALVKGLVKIKYHQLRQWAEDEYGTVDDKPFGGGVGMVMKVDVISRALEYIRQEVVAKKIAKNKSRVIALSARGKRYTQADAERLANYEQITLICGHYEGLDARIEDNLADECISIGDYVLTGGEIPAMVIMDSVIRLQKGVLGKDESSGEESFSKIEGKRQIEYPQYTRPREYKGWKVPEELISGDHKKIEEWKKNWLKRGKK